MIHWIQYSGKDSREFNAYITKKSAYNKPEKDISFISVPGRSGDIILDNGRYKNIKIQYGIKFFGKDITGRNNFDFAATYHRVADWLQTNSNYYILTDSYEPEYYRKACVSSSIALNQPHYQIGSFDVTFNCKPHKYRQDGEHIITLTASENTLTNCENAEALPLIRVYPTTTGGVSVFSVNGVSCTILSMPEYIDIDCEMMNAYYGTTNCNNKLSGLNFPVLVSGANSINLINNILKIELKPRWRAI